MSISENIKKIVLIVDRVDMLVDANKELDGTVRELGERVAFLEAREDAVVLRAEKAARKASKKATEAILALPRPNDGKK